MEIQRLVDIKKKASDRVLNNVTYNIKNKLERRNEKRLYEIINEFYSTEEALYEELHHLPIFNSVKGNSFVTLLSFYIGADYSTRNLPGNGTCPFGKLDFNIGHSDLINQVLNIYSTLINSNENLEKITSSFFEWLKRESKASRKLYEDESFIKFLEENPIRIGNYTFYGFEDNFNNYEFSRYSFDDLGGYEKIKGILQKIGKNAQRIAIRSKVAPKEILLPRGILLYGQPGTGKTSLALAFCNKFNIPYKILRGPDFRSEYVNQSANELQKKFDEIAREMKENSYEVYAVFIDEFDDIAKNRGAQMSEEDRKLISVINQNMDGTKAIPGRIIIAATNRPELIDPAIISRFNYKIEVGLPDYETRKKVFEKLLIRYTRNTETKLDNIDYDSLAKLTDNYSNRDINNIVVQTLLRKAEDFDERGAEPKIKTEDIIESIKCSD